MEIREYVRPADLASAYELLTKAKPNIILGGCTFLKRTRKKVGTAIDLRDCALSYIKDSADCVAIGAYTSLREIETSGLIEQTFGSVLREAMEHLIGVQLRYAITIGGHVYGRFGFSDIIPTLIALDARVKLFHQGEMRLWDFMQLEKKEKDILVEILLPKQQRAAKVQMMRTSYNDYSAFCLAVSRCPRGDWIIAGGVFPGRARLADAVMEKLNQTGAQKAQIPLLAKEIVESFSFGSNYRASADYRKELCGVFARRALEALTDED